MSEKITIKNTLLFELLTDVQMRADEQAWYERNPRILIEKIGDRFVADVELEEMQEEADDDLPEFPDVGKETYE